ncbi:MAG: AarF/ABC1/UbiB kinase family protein [Chrysiogenetes bacterium]|nr:AarF/ABC1/UbiB kinase family protein [Chrysiogenetes bacterium]
MIESLVRWIAVQWILFKYGFIGLLDKLGLRKLWYSLTGRSDEYLKMTAPVWLRMAFEDLGPTYIKLAQIIASSEGLFPKEYSEEFRKCLDRVPSFGFPHVERTLLEEFGRPYTEVFKSLDPVPIAAASIAQVHFATLQDGREVVVKVQRPHIEPRMRSDMKIMMFFAKIIQKIVPNMDLANPVGIIEDFQLTLFEELDFQLEGRNMDQFNEIMKFAGNENVVAPIVDWDYTNKRILTMERFRGWRVDDTQGVLDSPYDAEDMLVRGVRGWFQCVVLHGFFHGDVHAGNLMLLDEGKIGFLDFGIIGRFNEKQKGMVTEYILAFQTGNFRKLAQVLVEMGSVEGGEIDMEAFTADLQKTYTPWLDKSFADLKIKDLMPEVLRVSVKHRMRLPREFILITKQLLYFDRYAKALAPNLNIFNDPRLVKGLGEDLVMLSQMKASGDSIKDLVADSRPAEA